MSLTGNLEDLPLLDIIQIVSFSKKTGHLSIEMEGGAGGIVFRDGLVVAAFTATSLPADPRSATLSPERRDEAVRTRVAFALAQLSGLREGPFAFALAAEPPRVLGERDLTLETLSQGVNPQELLLDLAVDLDEDRARSAAAVEASFAAPEEGVVGETPPAVEEPTPPPVPPEAQTILLVDDEEDVRGVLGRHFTEAGYHVVEGGDPETAAKEAGRLRTAATPFVLVTDLGMPASGGASFHGGFEVIKRLWKMNLRPPVLMMTESLSQALRLRARQMGIQAFVFKPGLSKLNPRQFEADLQAFAAKVVADVLPRLAEAATSAPARPASPGGAASLGPPGAARLSAADAARPFEFLRRRLAELRQPGDANQIAALVMRVAREFFERAILLVVKNEQARGLGGFGLAPREETLNLLVRQVTIPLTEPSVFLDVAQGRKAFTGTLPHDRCTAHLMGRIGRFRSAGAALLPLVTHRETIALLFGDNPETGREVAGLEALEVFIHQAGIALENAFLQRRLEALQEKGRAGVR